MKDINCVCYSDARRKPEEFIDQLNKFLKSNYEASDLLFVQVHSSKGFKWKVYSI